MSKLTPLVSITLGPYPEIEQIDQVDVKPALHTLSNGFTGNGLTSAGQIAASAVGITFGNAGDYNSEDENEGYQSEGEEALDHENDIQLYEQIINRLRDEVVISEVLASRVTVDERKKKINCNLEDGSNCQMIVLSDEPINSAWSSFRYPRNLDDSLELIFTWADNYLNGQSWPQEEIFQRFKGRNYLYKYDSFKTYSQATMTHLLVVYYEQLKKKAENLLISSSQVVSQKKGVAAEVEAVRSNDQWADIDFKLTSDFDDLKFGYCCVLSSFDSDTSVSKHFGSILGKENIKENDRNFTCLTVRVFEFFPSIGEDMIISSLFRIHHIYTSIESLFKLESADFAHHYSSPDLKSGPSGVTLRLDEKVNLTSFDCDAIFKAVDTISLSAAEASTVCCLDYRETSKSLKDLTEIVAEILLSMRSVPIDACCIGLDIPALVICNNEEILSTLHEKFKRSNFLIYRFHRKNSPTNLSEKIPRIGKAIAKAFSRTKLIEDSAEYSNLAERWELANEGIFTSEDEEGKYCELIELAKVFAIRNSAVLLGNIYDVYNDVIINSSSCKIPVCIILGASMIPECLTLPLLAYGCEKFILIDRESFSWPGNKSLFSRLVSLYEIDHSISKGAKCCVVTGVRKRPKLPEPPKVSRHKIIELHTKDSTSSPDYNPDQRKNPRNRVPYCPKPTANPNSNPNPNNSLSRNT